MAVDLSTLVSKRKITLEELTNKVIAVDAYNVLYQFLSIIRGPDGMPLADSHGNVTSHLSGLFYRNTELMGYGIKPIYVFDGIPSMLKQRTIQARMKRREEAHAAWKEAMVKGEMEEVRVHAQGSTRMTKEIVASAKTLLGYMGIPYIVAPSEGEAQASIMCKNGFAYAVASQDYDTILFGAPLVARNLTLSGKRKLPRKNIYINVEPELMSFADTSSNLGLNQKQMIWIGILLGTDFNTGIKGIGPKSALKIVKGAKSIDDVEKFVKERKGEQFELDPREVESLFLNPEVKEFTKEEIKTVMQTSPDQDKLIEFMCKEHEFSEDRITKFAGKLFESSKSSKQRSIDNWI
jgi:flap endonuclease-1